MSLFNIQNRFYRLTTAKFLSQFLTFARNLTNPFQPTNDSLHLLFQEAVGLSETSPKPQPQTQTQTDDDLNQKLIELEDEVRHLQANKANGQQNVKGKANAEVKPSEQDTDKVGGEGETRLSTLFFSSYRRDKEARRVRRETKEPEVLKELSTDVKLLLNHLYRKGYFKKANFLPADGSRPDSSCFNDTYSRAYLQFASEMFGRDNQEIAKWLSGSDLKTVALFGCPSLSKKNVFAAKLLRNFFNIPEDTVCSKCVLRHSCNFVNQNQKGGNKEVRLLSVMRVITLYAMESVPPELQVPEDVRASVSLLLKEVINLSETTSKTSTGRRYAGT